MFSLVSTLGDEIKTVVKTVGQNPGNNSTEELTAKDQKGDPSVEKREVKIIALDGLPLEHEEGQGNDDSDDDDADDNVGINVGDIYVSHAYYRELVAEGVEKRAPPIKTSSEQACILSD